MTDFSEIIVDLKTMYKGLCFHDVVELKGDAHAMYFFMYLIGMRDCIRSLAILDEDDDFCASGVDRFEMMKDSILRELQALTLENDTARGVFQAIMAKREKGSTH